jgi:ABC-2 type transport system permease protein
MRRTILLGDPLGALMPDFLPLVFFAAILPPLRLVAFGYAVRRAKIEGSLTHYWQHYIEAEGSRREMACGGGD